MKRLPVIVAIIILFCIVSCKKENVNSDLNNKNLKIRYEISTSLPFANSHSVIGPLDNYISYVSDVNMNEQSVKNLTGRLWTKEVVVSNVPKNRIFSCSGQFYLQGENGTANVKIYINDVLKANVDHPTGASIQGLSIMIVGAQWINQ
jgi:hypothetical protein